MNDKDKKDLFIKSYDIFNKYYSEDPYFKKRYNLLVDLILNKKFDEAVLESNKLEKTQENMNNRSIFSRIKNKLVR